MGGFVAAISTSGQALGVHSACDVVPGGTCPPDFPAFWTLSALAGWESGNGRTRFLVGPAFARSSGKLAGAAQARVEVAMPITGHVSLLASGRFVHIPSYRGDSFNLGSIGVGLRLR